MSALVEGAKDVITITLPKTVKEVQHAAFYWVASLQSVVLNEGLETLGTSGAASRADDGVFERTCLRKITLPSTLREIG